MRIEARAAGTCRRAVYVLRPQRVRVRASVYAQQREVVAAHARMPAAARKETRSAVRQRKQRSLRAT